MKATQKTPALSVLSTLIILSLSTYHPVLAEEVQFNTDVLDVKDRANISLTQFSHAGYVMPGDYAFTVAVNGHALNDEQTITYYPNEKDNTDSQVCVPKGVADQLGLKASYAKKLTWWHDDQCLDLTSLDGMTATGDLGTSTLNISIPQAYLEYVSDTWDPPSRWDNGVNGAIFDYNLNATAGSRHRDYGNGRYYDISANGTTGLNVGAWRLRAEWQGSLDHETGKGSSTTKNLDVSEVYAYRPLPSIKSKLTLGETYYNSDVFDSFRFVGGRWSLTTTCCRRICADMPRKSPGWPKPMLK